VVQPRPQQRLTATPWRAGSPGSAPVQDGERKLMVMLHMVVAGLSRLEELGPIVQQLSVRHPGGVRKWEGNLVLQL